MKNKWIKDKQENLKSQDSDNLFIQTKKSVRHIKNNIENNKEVKKRMKVFKGMFEGRGFTYEDSGFCDRMEQRISALFIWWTG